MLHLLYIVLCFVFFFFTLHLLSIRSFEERPLSRTDLPCIMFSEYVNMIVLEVESVEK